MTRTPLITLFVGIVALGVPHAQEAQRFAGFYRLVSTERRGYLAYDAAGYVSMTTQRSAKPGQSPMAGYDAYFGPFSVDAAAGTITHRLFASLQPQHASTSLVRRFVISGNRLTLNDLTWERIPDPPSLSPAQQQLVGFWRLVSTERRTTTGELARAYPGWTGFIVYAPSGHMMVHMVEPYRRGFEGPEPTAEEAAAALRTYTSYFGTYTITGPGTLVHHMEGSLNPGSIGTDTQRFFEVSGTKLILRPPLIKTPQGDVVMTNVWERVTS